jgi:hypothetical protein
MNRATVQRRRRTDEQDLQSRVEELTPAQRAHFDAYLINNVTDQKLKDAANKEVDSIDKLVDLDKYSTDVKENALQSVENAIEKPVKLFSEVIFSYLINSVPRLPLYSVIAPVFEYAVSHVYNITGWDNKEKSLVKCTFDSSDNKRFKRTYKRINKLYRSVNFMMENINDVYRVANCTQYEAKFEFPENKVLANLIDRKNKKLINKIYKLHKRKLKKCVKTNYSRHGRLNNIKFNYTNDVLKARKYNLSSPKLEKMFFDELCRLTFKGIDKSCNISERNLPLLIDYIEKIGYENDLHSDFSKFLVNEALKSCIYKGNNDIEIPSYLKETGISLAEKIGYTEAVERFEALR